MGMNADAGVRFVTATPVASNFANADGPPLVWDWSNGILYGLLDDDTVLAINPATTTSGTYTPTLSNTTNITSSTAYVCQWLRVGDVVTVSGQVDIDTAGAGASLLGMSIPVASDFASSNQCGGTATTSTGTHNSAGILADATNNRASFSWSASGGGGSRPWRFSFTYLVV